jgi:hypothetical protein
MLYTKKVNQDAFPYIKQNGKFAQLIALENEHTYKKPRVF